MAVSLVARTRSYPLKVWNLELVNFLDGINPVC